MARALEMAIHTLGNLPLSFSVHFLHFFNGYSAENEQASVIFALTSFWKVARSPEESVCSLWSRISFDFVSAVLRSGEFGRLVSMGLRAKFGT